MDIADDRHKQDTLRPCAVIGPHGTLADRDRGRAEALAAVMHQGHQGLQSLQTLQGMQNIQGVPSVQGHHGLQGHQSHQSRWSQMCPPLFYPQRSAYPPRDISPRHTFQENMSRVVVPAPVPAPVSVPLDYDRRSYDKYALFRSRQLSAAPAPAPSAVPSSATDMGSVPGLGMPIDRSFYQCYPQYSDSGPRGKSHPQAVPASGYHGNHPVEVSSKGPTVSRVDVRYDPYSSSAPVSGDYRFGYARPEYPYRAPGRLPPPQTYGSPYSSKYGESYLGPVDPSQVPLQYQRYPDPQQFLYGVDPAARVTRMPPEIGYRVAEVPGRSLQQYYGQDKYVFPQEKSLQRGTVHRVGPENVRSADDGVQYYRNFGYPDGRSIGDSLDVDFHKTMAGQGMMKQPAPTASPYSDGRQFYGYQTRHLQTNPERLTDYDQAQYQRYYNRQKCVSFNPLAKIPTQFSPDVISPTNSVTSLDSPNVSNHVYLEDPGYVSQCSTGSGHSAEYHHHQTSNACDPKHIFANDDGRSVYGCHELGGRMLKSNTTNGDRSKPSMDLRQFLQMWDEEYEDPNVCKISSDMSNPNESQQKRCEGQKGTSNSQQLYVLDKVNIASEELHKYEHLQQVTQLPDNIKDVQNSKIHPAHNVRPNFSKTISKPEEIGQSLTKTSAISNEMVDVEAKITQSIIHKEVKCNFEIKPCSPGPVLCDVRPDVLAGVEPCIKVDIEYSSSPNKTNSSSINHNTRLIVKPVFTDMTEQDKHITDSLQSNVKHSNSTEIFKEAKKRTSSVDKSVSKWKPNCSSPSLITSKNKIVESKPVLDMPSNVAFVKPQLNFKNSKSKDNNALQTTINEINTHLKKSVIVLRSETAHSAELLTITNNKKCVPNNSLTKESYVATEELVSSHISMPILDSSQSLIDNVKVNEDTKDLIPADYEFNIKPDSIMDLLKPNSPTSMLTECSSKNTKELEKSYISDDFLPNINCEKKCDQILNTSDVSEISTSDSFSLNSLPILDNEYAKPECETNNSSATNKQQSPSVSSSITSDYTPINDFDMKSLENLVNSSPKDTNKSLINIEDNFKTNISSEEITSVNHGSFDSDSCEQSLFNSEFCNTKNEDLSQTENNDNLLEKMNVDTSPKTPTEEYVLSLEDSKKQIEKDVEYSKPLLEFDNTSVTKEQYVEKVSMLLSETEENLAVNKFNTTISSDNEKSLNSCGNINDSWLNMEEKVCDMLDSTIISPIENSTNEDSIECKNESKESCTLSSPIYSPKASVNLSCLDTSDNIKDDEMIMLTYSHIDETESLDFMHNDDEYKSNSSYDDTRNVFLFVDNVGSYKDGLKDASANDNFLFESLSPKYKRLRHDEMDSDSYDFEQSKTDNSTDFDHEMDFTSSVAVDGLELGGCWIDDIACVETVGSNDEADEINNYEEEKQNIHSPHTPEYVESDGCSQSSDNLMRDTNGNIIFRESSVDDINSNNRYKISNETSNSSSESKTDDSKPSLKLNIKKSVIQDGNKSEKKYEIVHRSKHRKNDSYKEKKYREYQVKKKKRVNTFSQSEPKTCNSTLITKGAKKYIPPLESDSKYNPLLKEHRKINKNEHSDSEGKLSVNRMVLPKKIPKPKFEDVLMHIDAANMSWNKLKLKQRKKVVPKMVIKKNDYGSHYTSSSKDESNDDSDTKNGTSWQPSVHLTRSSNIDEMLDGKDSNEKLGNLESEKCHRYVRKIKLKEYREKRERLPCIITISKSKAFPSQYTSQTSQQESPLQCTSRLINN